MSLRCGPVRLVNVLMRHLGVPRLSDGRLLDNCGWKPTPRPIVVDGRGRNRTWASLVAVVHCQKSDVEDESR